jgi:DNA-binding GntR family transcriptional regulator
MGLRTRSEVLRAEAVPASFDEAEELSIVPGTDLFHLDRVRLLDEVPIALDLTQVPVSVLPAVRKVDFAKRSLFTTLAEAGIEPVRADATIEARDADQAEAGHLQIPEGKPLLIMRQVSFDAVGRPLFTSTIKYVGERYRLRTSFSRPQSPARTRQS